MISLNKPFLPPQNEYKKHVDNIWKRNWLTNHGPLVREFEDKASRYLGTQQMVFVNNGTTALQIAIKALGLEGEIITTPYSYVATTSSIVWENCKPVFVDIDKSTLNIDPVKIESAISEKTSGIIATHIYGNPCDVEAIQELSEKHSLKVVYDAAHCFGVTYKNESIYRWGDVSIASFHATKLFHTVEGGGLFTGDNNLEKKIRYMMNFGHNGPHEFHGIGINGKNSEFHAAMGLCNLKYADQILSKRRELSKIYDEKLENMEVLKPEISDDVFYNYAYYPLLFSTEEVVKEMAAYLQKKGVETRRYFKPSLDHLPYVCRAKVPVSEAVSKRVLCLPLYYEMTADMINYITGTMKKFIVNNQ